MPATYGDAKFDEDLNGYRCTCTSKTGVSATQFYPEDNWNKAGAEKLCDAFCEGKESRAAELFSPDAKICRCPAFDATPWCAELSQECTEDNCRVACATGQVDFEKFEEGKCTCTGYVETGGASRKS